MKNKLFLGTLASLAATTLQGNTVKRDFTKDLEAQKNTPKCVCQPEAEKKPVNSSTTTVKKSDRLEDNVVDVTDVSFELHKNSRATMERQLEKYSENANFSFPVKMAQVNYHQKGDTHSTFNATVYVTPKMAKKLVNDKSISKVVVSGTQKKHKSKPVFIVKDIKPVFIANLEPESEYLITKKKEVKKSNPFVAEKKNKQGDAVSQPKSTKGVMKDADEIDIDSVIEKAAKKYS